MMKGRVAAALLLLLLGPLVGRAAAAGTVTVLAVGDALDPALLDAFTRETGDAVVVDPAPAPASVEAALRTVAYDLVLLPSGALAGLGEKHLLAPLGDLPEAAAIEPALTAALAGLAGSAVPFDWYPVGFVVNPTLLREQGLDSASGWDLLTRPEMLRKAATCGFGLPDRPRALHGVLAAALGGDRTGPDRRRLLGLLAQWRTAARPGTDVGLADDLVQGELCVAVLPAPMASVAIAAARASDDKTALTFLAPPDTSTLALDGLALPANGRNPAGGRALLRFLLRPDNAARNAHAGHVASGIRESPGPSDDLFGADLLGHLANPPAIDPAMGRAIDAEWRRAPTPAR